MIRLGNTFKIRSVIIFEDLRTGRVYHSCRYIYIGLTSLCVGFACSENGFDASVSAVCIDATISHYIPGRLIRPSISPVDGNRQSLRNRRRPVGIFFQKVDGARDLSNSRDPPRVEYGVSNYAISFYFQIPCPYMFRFSIMITLVDSRCDNSYSSDAIKHRTLKSFYGLIIIVIVRCR